MLSLKFRVVWNDDGSISCHNHQTRRNKSSKIEGIGRSNFHIYEMCHFLVNGRLEICQRTWNQLVIIFKRIKIIVNMLPEINVKTGLFFEFFHE